MSNAQNQGNIKPSQKSSIKSAILANRDTEKLDDLYMEWCDNMGITRTKIISNNFLFNTANATFYIHLVWDDDAV